MRNRPTVLALVLATTLLAGCATEISGHPTPSTPTNPTSPSGTDSVLPPPPQEIDINQVNEDPCVLLTPEQQAEYEFDVDPEITHDFIQDGTRSCYFAKIQENPAHSVVVIPLPTEPADLFWGSPNGVQEIIEIAGFPAMQNHLTGDSAGCFVYVSTAQDQSLAIQFNDDDMDSNIEAVCENARRVATMATETLVALHGS
ncbi:DUF3558 domain-containing protein [Actinoalloteichus hymeniacidonis]|uniref:DUF3558 family protein n=1 Tax=Actinoalloteichus hymeniacidonis TaxID=340345 RepID=A0AAC9HMB4_9PSEU|nr:DUF3558 domain-containing protein [Actinoalloteichus hymeniacidonis]AOS61743.1 putative DUF3558 family protein [Actinoalloteichus hymeniacidonis]MBB5910239.1 hypothetical protein [Actinoalloteichus hymeniacidonis]